MKITGFSDEVSTDIDKQIKALQTLGWKAIEIRLVGPGQHFDDVDEDTFRRIKDKLDGAGIAIIGYGSQIANWSRTVTGDFQADVRELKRIIPRMQKTGTKLVRIMSYPNPGLPEPEWKKETIRRIKELARMAEGGGVILGHENCDGWAGQGPRQSVEMIQEINSPALKLIYDTGNPISYRQDPWEFYQRIREHVIHVHIKDAVRTGPGKNEVQHCLPGQGQGQVARVLTDLKENGYNGWYSIEPHIAAVIHEGKNAESANAEAVFIQYGRMAEQLIRDGAEA
jgi:sugar phosphate isomerase/epimerase